MLCVPDLASTVKLFIEKAPTLKSYNLFGQMFKVTNVTGVSSEDKEPEGQETV
jgi:hypothetical protein